MKEVNKTLHEHLGIVFQVALVVKNLPASAGDMRCRFGLCVQFLGLKCFLEVPGNPLQYPCLENPMDRETWQATVHNIVKSGTQSKWLRHTQVHEYWIHFQVK